MGLVRPIEYEDSVELPGKMAWFLSVYTKVMGTHGDNGGVLILSHDITARKNMEESLRKSEEHYSKLLATIPDIGHRDGYERKHRSGEWASTVGKRL